MAKDNRVFTPPDVQKKFREGLDTATISPDGEFIELGNIRISTRTVSNYEEALRRYQEEHDND